MAPSTELEVSESVSLLAKLVSESVSLLLKLVSESVSLLSIGQVSERVI